MLPSTVLIKSQSFKAITSFHIQKKTLKSQEVISVLFNFSTEKRSGCFGEVRRGRPQQFVANAQVPEDMCLASHLHVLFMCWSCTCACTFVTLCVIPADHRKSDFSGRRSMSSVLWALGPRSESQLLGANAVPHFQKQH